MILAGRMLACSLARAPCRSILACRPALILASRGTWRSVMRREMSVWHRAQVRHTWRREVAGLISNDGWGAGAAGPSAEPCRRPKQTRASNLVQNSCPYCGGRALASGAGKDRCQQCGSDKAKMLNQDPTGFKHKSCLHAALPACTTEYRRTLTLQVERCRRSLAKSEKHLPIQNKAARLPPSKQRFCRPLDGLQSGVL